MQAKFITVNGVRTRYLSAGTGEPLLLLHGIGMSGDCWLRNIDALAERHTVIAPDFLGQGFTDSVDFADSASQVVNARHVAALMETLGFSSYSVVGSSYGGLVAALTYFQNPGRVRKLGLIGSASAFQSEQDQAKALRAAAALAEQALSAPTLASCRRRMEGILFDPATVPSELIWLQATAYALPDRKAAYAATIEACLAHLEDRETRVAWRLEQIKIPVYIIVGRNDVRADWRQHVVEAERMPTARLSIFEQCGHMPFIEHPDRFNAEISAFLAE